MCSIFADRDGDELLTEEEFACLQVGEGGDSLLSQGEAERRAEFRMFLDIDKDGKADRKEIIVSVNSRPQVFICSSAHGFEK